jgi:hypothetical protein
MDGQFLAILIPCRLPSCSSLRKSLERTSEPKIKGKGDKGLPCLRPREGLKNPKGEPSIKMEKEEVEMH